MNMHRSMTCNCLHKGIGMRELSILKGQSLIDQDVLLLTGITPFVQHMIQGHLLFYPSCVSVDQRT